MTVLITGGAGYIGSHMVHELRDSAEPSVVLDDLSTGMRWLVPEDIPFVHGSTGDSDLVQSIICQFDVDAIIHFAASTVVPESLADPLKYYRNNTMNTCALVSAAVRCGVRHLIFSSTAAVYGDVDGRPVEEGTRTEPISPYGASKLMVETMLRDVGKAHDFRYVALRYFNVAGADPRLRTGQCTEGATHLIKVALEVAVGLRSKLPVFGADYPTADGTCVRDYIHVTDLVRAHSAALRYLRNGGESAVLNCGYGHGASVFDVIASVRRVSGRDLPYEIDAPRDGDPVAVVADPTRIRDVLGWAPQFDDLDTIVSHALAWERRLLAFDRSGARPHQAVAAIA